MLSFGYSPEGYIDDYQKCMDDTEEVIRSTFTISLHPYSLTIADTQEDRQAMKSLLLKRGVSHEGAEELLIGDCAFCLYVRDMYRKREPVDDYLVVLPDKSLFLPEVIGEEITHGEHICLHSEGTNGPDINIYEKKFDKLSSEFIGSLGFYSVLQKTGKDFSERPWFNDRYNLNRYINAIEFVSHSTARQFLNDTDDVDYKSLFRAHDANEMWSLVSSHIGKSERIRVKVDKKSDRDFFMLGKTLVDYTDIPVVFDVNLANGEVMSLWGSGSRPR